MALLSPKRTISDRVRRAVPVALAACFLAGLVGCSTPPLPPEALPPRQVVLSGTLNTRDLGGYETADGRRVRWGQILRSDQLSDLDDDDLDVLSEIGIRRVFDLRSAGEREGHEDRLPPNTRWTAIPMLYPSMDPDYLRRQILSGVRIGTFEAILQRANHSFAIDHRQEFSYLLHSLNEPNSLPALFHCTYGKDRTGFAAAMLLYILGVPRETVQADYLLSNAYLAGEAKRIGWLAFFGSFFQTPRAEMERLVGVDASYLQAAYDAMEEEYGSVEGYLIEGLGFTAIEQQRLRDKLLE